MKALKPIQETPEIKRLADIAEAHDVLGYLPYPMRHEAINLVRSVLRADLTTQEEVLEQVRTILYVHGFHSGVSAGQTARQIQACLTLAKATHA